MVFDLFRGVAHAHETVLSAIHRIIVSMKFEVMPFTCRMLCTMCGVKSHKPQVAHMVGA